MRLSDCFMEMIAYTAFIAHKEGGRMMSYDQVRANMLRLIQQSESCMSKGGFAQEDYNTARFAVFAWMDETILSSQWEERRQWQREQLQRQYYQTADAGEIFFDRLNSLGPHQRDVREVFYLCLSLGFSGQYCNEGDEFLLEQLRTSNLKYLTGSSIGVPSLDKEDMFPEAYPRGQAEPGDALHKGSRWSWFTVACTGAPVLLYVVLFLIYKFILGNVAGNLLGTV